MRSAFLFFNGVSAYAQKEVHLYGSSCLGIRKYDDRSITIGAPVSDDFRTPLYLRSREEKLFEFSNHLGNTLVTLTDQKLGEDESADGMSDYYASVAVSTSDYYPFGLAIGGRTVSSDMYRYGFNGKENDTEWGQQLIQDYGFRWYNPTIAKFLSVDPLAKGYPWYTPYQFAGNKPIWAVDLDGLEEAISTSSPYGQMRNQHNIKERRSKLSPEAVSYTHLTLPTNREV